MRKFWKIKNSGTEIIIVLTTFFLLLLLFKAVIFHNEHNLAEQTMHMQETSDTINNAYGLTTEEKDFLLLNIINEESTVEQIRTGTLPDWKIDLVLKYRFCLRGLNKKYPGHEFRIQTFEKIGTETWKFYAVDENQKVFTISISAPELEMLTDTYDRDE